MKSRLCLFAMSILICFGSCGKEDREYITWSGTVDLNEQFVVGESQVLIIKEGTIVNFGFEGSIMLEGELFASSLTDNPVMFVGPGARPHTILVATRTAKIFLYHVHIYDGLISSMAKRDDIRLCKFFNTQKLASDNALYRSWYGTTTFVACSAESNNTGEGFLLHNTVNSTVAICNFKNVPDAVEYIECENGLISNNTFSNCSDDAIDLNHCTNIRISNNEIIGTKDRGIEIGSQGYGPSTYIQAINNVFSNCKTGINIKEGSEAVITNSTFTSNETAIEIVDDEISNYVSVESSAFLNNEHIITGANSDVLTKELYSIKSSEYTEATVLILDNSRYSLVYELMDPAIGKIGYIPK